MCKKKLWSKITKIKFVSKKLLVINTFLLLFLTVSPAHAGWNGNWYQPGETLDPECVPGDVDCEIDISAFKNNSPVEFSIDNNPWFVAKEDGDGNKYIVPASSKISLGSLAEPFKEIFVSADSILVDGTRLSNADGLLKWGGHALTMTPTASNSAEIRLGELSGNGSNYVALKAPSAITSNLTLTLPATAGSNGQTLSTNGSGILSWSTPASSGITSFNGLTATSQIFATGATGTDFNIASSGGAHTFNIPSASATARGLVTTNTQIFAGDKTFANNLLVNGNVGIGTTSPSYHLELAGTNSIAARTIGVNGIPIAYLPDQSSFYGSLGIGNGLRSLSHSTGYQGQYNTAVGINALLSATTGHNNTALGTSALYSNTTGYDNTALGVFSLSINTTGYDNVAVGQDTLGSSSTSIENTAIGSEAGINLTGNKNILLGYSAASNLTTGNNNIVIGYKVNTPAANSSNTLNIGNLIFGTGINGTGSTLSSGNVGIGTTVPGDKLDVFGGITIGSNGAGSGILTSYYDRDGYNNIWGKIYHSGNASGLRIESHAQTSFGDSGRISFWNSSDDSASTEKMRISSTGGLSLGNSYVGTNPGAGNMIISGNIGIGTTSPAAKLDVAGSIRGNSGLTITAGAVSLPSGQIDNVELANSSFTVTSGTGLTGGGAVSLGGLTTVSAVTTGQGISMQGNFGQWQAHSTYTDFNVNPAHWGWNYVQGNTNAPNSNSAQWYRNVVSLGSEYPMRGAGGYSLELAFPRANQAAAGAWMRAIENGAIGGWTQIGFTNPMTAAGDLIYRNAGGATRLGIGTAGQVLTVSGGVPVWASAVACPTCLINNGNSFGALATMGTNDNQALAFETNNIEQMRITNAGNVGVGTASPTDQLHIYKSDSNRITTQTGGAGYSGVRSINSNVNFFAGVATSHYYIYENSPVPGARLMILSGGNVGIGAVSPGEKLDIAGNTRLLKTNTATATTQYASGDLKLQSSSWDTALNNGDGGESINNFSLRNTGLSGENASYRLGILNNDGTELLSVRENGNVGIGTASPSQKLDIAGNLKVDGAIVAPEGTLRDDGGGWVRTYGATGWHSQTYGGGWYMSDTSWIRTYGNKGIYQNSGIMRTDGTLQVGDSGSTLSVGNGGNFAYRGSVLTANSSGRVGIGTNNPEYTLTVRTATSNDAISWNNPSFELGRLGAPWDNGNSGWLSLYDSGTQRVRLHANDHDTMLEIDRSDVSGALTTARFESKEGWIANGGTWPSAVSIGGISTWNILVQDISYASLFQRSDRNFKKDITSLNDNMLEKVSNLRPVSFFWKDEKANSLSGNKIYGFIAQEVNDIFPDLVSGEDGELSLDTTGLIPVLTKSVQELNIKVDTLTATAPDMAKSVFSDIELTSKNYQSLEEKVARLDSQVADLMADETREMPDADQLAELVIKKIKNENALEIDGLLELKLDTLFSLENLEKNGALSFDNDIIFHGRLTYEDKDMAGYAKIKKGGKEVKVAYEKPYEFEPVVTATALDKEIMFILKERNKEGFTIEISDKAKESILFSWHAILVKEPLTAENESEERNESASESTSSAQQGFSITQSPIPEEYVPNGVDIE